MTRFLSLIVLLVLVGCASPKTATQSSNTFSAEVLPLIQEKFAPLLASETGLRLDSWDTLMQGSDFGEVVIPFDADNSLLLELATKQTPVPLAAAAITEADIAVVREWINNGARNDAGDVPFANASNLLFVCNQMSAMISIIDMDTNVVIRNIKLMELGYDMNARPHHVAVEPDGSGWYVSLIGASKVLKFNSDHELVAEVEFETPGMLALDPTSDELFVGRSMMAVNPPQRIGRINRTDMGIEEIDVFFPRPHAIALDTERDIVYTASLAENRIGAVDLDSEETDLTLVEGETHTFVQFALSPDGQTMIGTGQMTGQLLFFDLSDPAAPEVVGSVDVNGMPWHPVFTPDGRYAYFGNQAANTVTVINMAERRVEKVIDGNGLSQPHGAAISPDGKYVYVSNRNMKGAYMPRYKLGDNMMSGTVTVIDTASNEIVKVLELERYPSGINTSPR